MLLTPGLERGLVAKMAKNETNPLPFCDFCRYRQEFAGAGNGDANADYMFNNGNEVILRLRSATLQLVDNQIDKNGGCHPPNWQYHHKPGGEQSILAEGSQPLADVSTPGHGQGAGPARYEFREAGRRRLWEGPECRTLASERSSARGWTPLGYFLFSFLAFSNRSSSR